MTTKKDELRKQIEMLTGQQYEELPNHNMVGKTVRLKHGDPQFFEVGTKKTVQAVRRGSRDGKLYYVVLGDNDYRHDLFRVPVEDFE